jgi:hypothetical protein
MKKLLEIFFIVLAFILANAFMYLFWWALTDPGNYIWQPVSAFRQHAVESACDKIFWINFTTWTVLVNLFLMAFLSYQYYTRFSLSLALLSFVVYASSWYTFGPYLSQSYVSIFENQAVSHVFLTEPIKRGGQGAGEILLKKIKNPDYPRRESAIKALGEIHHEPAAEHLGRILLNEKEPQKIRGAAYLALKEMGTSMSKKYLLLFSQLMLQNDKEREVIRRLEKNNEY